MPSGNGACSEAELVAFVMPAKPVLIFVIPFVVLRVIVMLFHLSNNSERVTG